jgi:hypothetical protein
MGQAMSTRRDVITHLAAIPLVTAFVNSASAQDSSMVTALFGVAFDRLRDPGYVRAQYAALGYYVELLRTAPPQSLGFAPVNVAAATTTYGQLGESIRSSEGKFDTEAAAVILPDLKKEYENRQKLLWDYLQKAGISIKSPADMVLESAIVSMLLFDAAATKAKQFAQLRLCIFPFCRTLI